MKSPSTLPRSEHQTTVSTWVFRIFFDDCTGKDDVSDLCHRNESIGARHLFNRMRQVEYLLRGSFAHTFQNLEIIQCHVYVSQA